MSTPPHLRKRSTVAIDGAMGLIVVLLVTQMWLLTATLENFLAGHRETALPGAVLAGLLFAGCVALYLFVLGIDRERDGPAAGDGR